MVITFEINDATSLASERRVSVKVSGVQADESEMEFVSKLTANVKYFAEKTVKEKDGK